MTQVKPPALPQFSAPAPVSQAASVRAGSPEPESGDQAFSKVLDRRLNNSEPSRPAAPPAGKAERAAGEKPAAAGKAPPPDQPAAPAALRAGLGVVPDTISIGNSAQAEALAAPPDQPLEGAATDPLQASLAGLPAALAALMGAAAPTATSAASAPDAATQVTGDTAGRNPDAALARLLGEAAGGRKDLSATAATGSDEAGTVPTAGEQDDSFATALAALSGPDERRTVLSAVATEETGPASAAADTAKAAGNPSAGDAALHAGAAASAASQARNHREDASLQLHVAQPPNHPGWADRVADRVTWLAGKNESKAELVLTPPQLGRVEVSLTVTGDQTTAQFVAATPAAREALEQALPRLREALAEAGIQLAQSGVSTSDQQNAREQHGRQGSPRHTGDGPSAGEVTPSGGAWRQSGRGLVDTFA